MTKRDRLTIEVTPEMIKAGEDAHDWHGWDHELSGYGTDLIVEQIYIAMRLKAIEQNKA